MSTLESPTLFAAACLLLLVAGRAMERRLRPALALAPVRKSRKAR